jgi:hypothetical protein
MEIMLGGDCGWSFDYLFGVSQCPFYPWEIFIFIFIFPLLQGDGVKELS